MDAQLVLFDLGGVLIELGGVGELRVLAGMPDDEAVWRRWLGCRWVRAFERGQCTTEAFAEGLVRDWSLDVAPEDWLRRFLAWPLGLYEGAWDLVREIPSGVRTGCLSNTNEAHWARFARDWRLEDLFEVCFLSFRLGKVKPDPEMYEHVIQTSGCEAARILVLDDNRINVEAALAAGMQAEHVRGVEGARRVLGRRGIIGRP